MELPKEGQQYKLVRWTPEKEEITAYYIRGALWTLKGEAMEEVSLKDWHIKPTAEEAAERERLRNKYRNKKR